MKTKSIKQTIKFDANRVEVYNLLTDAKKLETLTGSKVNMNKRPNGKFSVFDGYCHGYNIELVEGEKIVQAWHFAEDGWPNDHFSTCTFLFEQVDKKTKLTFTQTNVPEHKVEELKGGWKQFFWDPMKEYLKNS